MKKLLVLLFISSLISVNAWGGEETEYVSTCAELQAALAKPYVTTVIVNNRIVLESGTYDGRGKTVRVAHPYLNEDGSCNSAEADTIDNGVVFFIPVGAEVTLQGITIMGGRVYKPVPVVDNNQNRSERGDAAISNRGVLTITDCTITRSFRGIHNYNGYCVITHSNIIRNYGRFGSGILNERGRISASDNSYGTAKMVLDRCSFSENRSFQDGGALENKGGALMFMNNTTIANNSASAATLNNYSSYLYVMNCTITGNVSWNNKYVIRSDNSNLFMVNTILTDNKWIKGGTAKTAEENEILPMNFGLNNATKKITENGVEKVILNLYKPNAATLYYCVVGKTGEPNVTYDHCIINEKIENVEDNPSCNNTTDSLKNDSICFLDVYKPKYINCTIDSCVGGNVFADYVNAGVLFNTQVSNYYYTGTGTNTAKYDETTPFVVPCTLPGFIKPQTTTPFTHGANVHENGYLIAPIDPNGVAATAGTSTYFDYVFTRDGSGKVTGLNVNMSFDKDGVNTKLGTHVGMSNTPTGHFINGDIRDTGTIGSSPKIGSEKTIYNLFLDKNYEYTKGVVNGATVYGESHLAGTVITISAVGKTGYGLLRWEVTTETGGVSTKTNIEKNPYTFALNTNTTVKPIFFSHEHEWAYEGVRDTIYAYCVGHGDQVCVNYGNSIGPKAMRLAITPPANLQYDGTGKYVTVEASAAWPAEYTVTYYASSANGGKEMSLQHPTAAGRYYAVVTSGGAEARVAFTIYEAGKEPLHVWEAIESTTPGGKMLNNGRTVKDGATGSACAILIDGIATTFGGSYVATKILDDTEWVKNTGYKGDNSAVGEPYDGVGIYDMTNGTAATNEFGNSTTVAGVRGADPTLKQYYLPAKGAYMRLEPDRNGTVTIWGLQEMDKPVFLMDEMGTTVQATAMESRAGTPTEVTDDNGLRGYTVPKNSYVKYSFPLIANKTYFYFAEKSNITVRGFNFEAANETPKSLVLTETSTGNGNANTTNINDIVNSENRLCTIAAVAEADDRAIAADTWTTIVLPFSMTESLVQRVFGEGTNVVAVRAVSESVLYVYGHWNQNIMGGVPYLFKPKKGGYLYDMLHKAGVTVYVDQSTAQTVDLSNGYSFVGSFENGTITAGDHYISKAGNLSQWTRGNNTSNNPLRAVIKAPKAPGQSTPGQSNAAKLVMAFSDLDEGGTSTSIFAMDKQNLDYSPTMTVYGLDGQLLGRDATSLEHLPKGVYIVNGRKMVVGK